MVICAFLPSRRCRSERGFTLLDTLVVVAVIGIVGAMAVPSTTSSLAAYRLRNDAQALYNLVTLSKMRAASRFTRTRVYVDRAANTYRMEVLDRVANSWVAEGGVATTNTGVRFGFSTLDTPPPNTQVEIGQSSGCTDATQAGGAGNVIDGTSCIVFNSRGVPIDMVGTIGAPLGGNAFYITNGSAVYAITVTATPLVRFWWSPSATAAWQRQ